MTSWVFLFRKMLIKVKLASKILILDLKLWIPEECHIYQELYHIMCRVFHSSEVHSAKHGWHMILCPVMTGFFITCTCAQRSNKVVHLWLAPKTPSVVIVHLHVILFKTSYFFCFLTNWSSSDNGLIELSSFLNSRCLKDVWSSGWEIK